jgi:hypothetical protein
MQGLVFKADDVVNAKKAKLMDEKSNKTAIQNL